MRIVTEVNLIDKYPIKVGRFNVIKMIKLSEILNAVCEVNNVSPYDVKGKRRFRNLVTARREYCYLACELTQYSVKNPHGNSLSVIGAEINKDHATVLHHKNTILNWLEIKGYKFKEKIEQIEEML